MTQDVILSNKHLNKENCDIPVGYFRLSCYFASKELLQNSTYWSLSGTSLVPKNSITTIKVDTINEVTSGTGVTADSVLLKDSAVLVGNGAVGTPSVTFASDTDTGLYRTAANTLGVSAGGSLIVSVGETGLKLTKSALTQATNITTTVAGTGAYAGTITTQSATTAAGASSTFTVTTTAALATSTVVLSVVSYAGNQGKPRVSVTTTAAGSFNVTIDNIDAANALNGVLVLAFSIL